MPAGTGENSLSQMVNFNPQAFELPAYGKQIISYTINTPGDFDKGHYGVLFLEKDAQAQDANVVKGLTIVTRVGSLFFIEPTNKSKTATIENISINAGKVATVFKNEGNVILIPKGTYYIMDNQGLVADRGTIESIYLPAGKESDFNFSVREDLADGAYQLVMTVELQEGDVMVKEIDFSKSGSNYNISDIRN